MTREPTTEATAATLSRPAARPPVTPWLIGVSLGLATLALYLPSVRCPFIAYDDPVYVTGNAHVLGGLSIANVRWALTAPAAANWHPLTWLSHQLDVSLYAFRPAGHHLTSVLLHVASTVMLFAALRRATRATWRSAAVAAAFGWHPLRVESVAWVAERKDVLSGAFFVAMLLAYVAFAQRPRTRTYLLSLLLFAAGLMAKPMLVTAPFVLLLLDYWPLRRFGVTIEDGHLAAAPNGEIAFRNVRELVFEKLPFAAIALASCIVTFIVQRLGGAVATLAQFPIPYRVQNAIVANARYLGAIVAPVHLSVFYPLPSAWPIWCVVGAGTLAAVITLAAWLLRRPYPYLLVGWLWFVGMLVPVIGLVQVGLQSMADRYTYLPSIGLTIAIVWAAADLARRLRVPAPALFIGAGAVLTGLALTTLHQISYWQSTEALFEHALAVTHDNWLAHGYVGSALAARGEVASAEAHFREAIRLNPDSAYAHYNLGNSLTRRGELDAAAREYAATLRADPQFAMAYHNLGIVRAQEGQLGGAEKLLAEAVRLQPDYAEGWLHLGTVREKLADDEDAADCYREALRLRPDFAAAEQRLQQITAAIAAGAQRQTSPGRGQ